MAVLGHSDTLPFFAHLPRGLASHMADVLLASGAAQPCLQALQHEVGASLDLHGLFECVESQLIHGCGKVCAVLQSDVLQRAKVMWHSWGEGSSWRGLKEAAEHSVVVPHPGLMVLCDVNSC